MQNKKYNIYLDNAATTLPDEEVLSLYTKINREYFANPSSTHHLGMIANQLLTKSKQSILKSLALNGYDIIFTSSSTEAINIAIKGYALKYQNRGKHIITTNIEHPSVLESINQLKELYNFDVTILSINNKGVIELEDLKKAIRNDTILVSIMALNNEIGSVNNVEEISKIVHSYPKCYFLSDTTQAIGKMKINYNDLDMFVVSAHKIHGLKNSGALIYKKNLTFVPLITGGGQEYGFRSGTIALANDVCLAKAINLNKFDNKNYEYISNLRDILFAKLKNIDGICLNSSISDNPYIINFSLTNKKAAVVVEALSNLGIYVSSVSACHSRKEMSSHVVYALTKDDRLASNTIRVSLSKYNSLEDIDVFIKELKEILETIR